MENLQAQKKQKGKYILKWLYVKNKEAFTRKSKERFSNNKAVLKALLEFICNKQIIH